MSNKTQQNHIVLYRDEFDEDVWQEYCDICGVPSADTREITIKFYDIDVETR